MEASLKRVRLIGRQQVDVRDLHVRWSRSRVCNGIRHIVSCESVETLVESRRPRCVSTGVSAGVFADGSAGGSAGGSACIATYSYV